MTAYQSAQASRKRHEEAAAWVLKNRDINQSAHESRAFEEWLDRGQENRTAYEAAERLMGEARTVILNDPALRNFKVKPRPRVAKTLAVAILGAALAGGVFPIPMARCGFWPTPYQARERCRPLNWQTAPTSSSTPFLPSPTDLQQKLAR